MRKSTILIAITIITILLGVLASFSLNGNVRAASIVPILDSNSNSHKYAFYEDLTSAKVTISTSSSKDIVYAVIYTDDTGLTYNKPLSANLPQSSWSLRGSITAGTSEGQMVCWYTVANSPLASEAITFSATSRWDEAAILVFAVSGANTDTPFDSGLPATISNGNGAATGCSGVSSVTVLTKTANDLIVGLVGVASSNDKITFSSLSPMDDSYTSGHDSTAADAFKMLSSGGSQAVQSTFCGATWVTMVDAFVPADGPATHFAVSAPASTIAGTPFTVTVTALDASDFTSASYSGTIHFTSTDSQAVLPADSTISNGVGTFTVTLKTSGSQTITATDTAVSTITGYANVQVNSASANKLVFTSGSGQTLNAGQISQEITVQLQDLYGNPVTSGLSGISLTSTSDAGVFYSDAGNTAATAISISAGESTTTFYYTDASVGAPTLSASAEGITPATTQMAVNGITVTFTETGLPTGTSWSLTFDNTVYSSTTDTINIPNVSALSHSWTTANFIQTYQTRYLAAETSGSLAVPSATSQNIIYATQYLVTYTSRGNILPVTVPNPEWINSGAAATSSFTVQVISSQADTRCNFVSDDRPETINAPTTITAIYQTQYLVTYAAAGNSLPVNVPSNQWVNDAGAATATYPIQVLNDLQNTQCNLIGDDRPSSINNPTTVTATYQTQYYITIASSHGSPSQQSQWINQGNSLTTSVTSPDGSTTHRWISTGYSIDNGASTSGTSCTLTNIQASHSITFNWQEQYYLTVTSQYTSTSGSGWYNAGTTATASISNGVASGGTGTQYVFTNWGTDASGLSLTSNAITMNSPKTATANWKTQYYLTVSSAYSSVSGAGWYDNGATAYPSLSEEIVPVANGVQNVFIGWGIDASGQAQIISILMNGPKTATAFWETDYYLSIDSSCGNPTGQGWYNSGTVVTVSTTQTANSATNSRNSFNGWTGSGTSAYTGPAATYSITINGPTTETASWTTQYLVTYAAKGNVLTVTVPANEWVNAGTAAKGIFPTSITNPINDTQCIFISDDRPSTITQPTTINGTYQTQYIVKYATTGNDMQLTTPTSEWVNTGSSATGIFQAQAINPTGDTRSNLINDNRTTTITSPTTITANYQTQYLVTFNQSGLDKDATGTVVTILGEPEGYSQLAATAWVNSGSAIDFSYNATVKSTSADKRYMLSEVNATSGFIVNSATLIQGTYQPQYSTSLYTVAEAVIALLAIAILALLLLATRRRRKKNVTATAGPNGTIAPNGKVSINRDGDQSFYIKANLKHQVSDVQVDGKSIGAIASYTFKKVQENHTISATFKSI